jgi:hypothetical protein
MYKANLISIEAVIQAFLDSTEGNWRHSFYITCHCKYEKDDGC